MFSLLVILYIQNPFEFFFVNSDTFCYSYKANDHNKTTLNYIQTRILYLTLMYL